MNQDASTEVRESTSTFATLRWVALAAVIVATVAGAFYYWRHVELYPTTENAYTGSNIVRVASEVSGPVIRVYVADRSSRSRPAIPCSTSTRRFTTRLCATPVPSSTPPPTPPEPPAIA